MKPVTIDKVLEIINTHINEVELTTKQVKDNLPDLGMDSITFIQIIVALEEEFECEIPDSKLLISEMDTIEKILTVLQDLYNETVS